MKKLLFAITALMLSVAAQAQTTDSEVLDVTRKANDYFMAQNPTPESDTFVHGKKRPSSLWTRGVYYEGLTALWEIDRQQRYIDYIDRWANYHQWTPRNGVKTTHADDQCCSQTYIWRYRQTGDKRMLVSAVENLDMEIAGGKVDWWWWIDAIQMALPVFAQATVTTGDRRYIDFGMKLYRHTRNVEGGGLFNEKSGLWWRRQWLGVCCPGPRDAGTGN